ncbi:response regulator [Corallococcus sp. AB049A]|uniref:histidine kinase n=1 Tax=Corallococcus interemptor TaxID=2316720 RepID=A0A3A8QYM8_9BACT|nr:MULTISPECIES: response regulator [Corallococcus]RKH41743.1 response regulator [Corallococcus sp. AB050B]RKH72858.1 response regulator [Corallococcus interemptor]RKI50238.1 response regulator [Corallococcus sp. AB049A]
MLATVKATILHVNDTPASLYLGTYSLRLAGYDVLEAVTGAEALEVAFDSRPDVIVLDVKLPDMSGYDVCRRLKEDPRTRESAIIHTSATFITAEKKVAGLRAGADVYLTRPFDPEELIATVNSVLRLRRVEREALANAARLEEAGRKKDEFLAMLAHELRNPLAAISVAVQMLGQKDSNGLSEADARRRDIIERQVSHLRHLVDDLLDVSRITRGKYALRRGRLDLNTVLQHSLAAARPVMEERGLILREALPTAPCWMDGDRTRLEQVFTNLLDNASKYSPDGGIVTVGAHVTEDSRVRVSVQDTGIGLRPEDQAHIFELFAQLDAGLARSRGGLGIGLTLVRHLVEEHGGQVEVFSEGQGQGSIFTVTLPLLTDAARPEPAVERVESRRGEWRILLVDDNPDAREGLREMLQMWGHTVAVASDGPEALVMATSGTYDVIILDIGLPGLDGYQVAQELRGRVASDAHLIALTGYGTPEDRARSEDAGFDLHLVKPVELVEIGRVLAQLGPVKRGVHRRPQAKSA